MGTNSPCGITPSRLSCLYALPTALVHTLMSFLEPRRDRDLRDLRDPRRDLRDRRDPRRDRFERFEDLRDRLDLREALRERLDERRDLRDRRDPRRERLLLLRERRLYLLDRAMLFTPS